MNTSPSIIGQKSLATTLCIAIILFASLFLFSTYVFDLKPTVSNFKAGLFSLSGHFESKQFAVIDPSSNPLQNQLLTASSTIESRVATTTLLFLGDMMFDRGVRAQATKIGYEEMFLNYTKSLSANYDLTIANLEGPITTFKSKTINAAGKGIPGFSFTFATSTAKALKDSGIDVVSLANNHTENFGQSGLRQTIEWLGKANVTYFGNPTNDPGTKAISPITKRVCTVGTIAKDICISFIGYHEFTYQNDAEIIKQIKASRKNSDLVIVMPHWGVEYKHVPGTKQISLARSWIDAGADSIIGAHPHVIQTFEIYNEKPIFYSLGNYIFDQYFSYHTTHGLAVGFTLTEPLNNSNIKTVFSSTTPGNVNDTTGAKSTDNTTFAKKRDIKLSQISLIPIDNTNIKTRATTKVDTDIMLKKLREVSIKFTPKYIQDQILSGTIIFDRAVASTSTSTNSIINNL